MFDLGLKDRIAIVTGGGDGLGRATAARLASEGCKVAICARRADHLEAAAKAIVELKILAVARLCRGVIPVMRERGGGCIVSATIAGGKAPLARAPPTTVTRAAGINLTKSLANEYVGDDIRVNTVCIGLLKNAQWYRRAAYTTGAAINLDGGMAAVV